MKFVYTGMQRCGTKSFGDFFRKNGYRVFSWSETVATDLYGLFADGKWLDILNSGIFNDYDVFEDAPFSDPAFARFLYNYVEDSRFVYFYRPPSDWYKSMVTHSKGLTLGQVGVHCYTYDRLGELEFIYNESGHVVEKLGIVGMKEHYERVYIRHKQQIEFQFSRLDNKRFFHGNLYDKEKFRKLASHFNLEFSDLSEQHSHKSTHSFADVIKYQQCLFIAPPTDASAVKDMGAMEKTALLHAGRVERDALSAEKDGLISERDTLIGERDALIEERDTLIEERDTLKVRRDKAISQAMEVKRRPLKFFLHRLAGRMGGFIRQGSKSRTNIRGL